MNLDIPSLGQSVTLKSRDRMRTTEIAEFKSLAHAVLIEPGLLDKAMTGGIKLGGEQQELIRHVIAGFDVEEVELMLKLFATVISEGVALDPDWGALDVDEKIDVLDLKLSPLDIFTAFISLWMYYNGMQAHIQKDNSSEG